MKLPIKDLKKVGYEDELYYFTENMLDNGIFIKYSNGFDSETNEIETVLEVCCLTQNKNVVHKAEYFCLYWGKGLEPIQIYQIIKNVYEIYSSHSKKEFIFIVEELSSQFISSFMQTDLEKKKEMLIKLSEEIEFIKNVS